MKANLKMYWIGLTLLWTVCLPEGIQAQTDQNRPYLNLPYVTQVQRQVWQDLMRFDYCDSIRSMQFWYIDSLEWEIYNRQIFEQKLRDLLTNKDQQIELISNSYLLDMKKMGILTRDERRFRKQNRWLKIGIGLATIGLLLK